MQSPFLVTLCSVHTAAVSDALFSDPAHNHQNSNAFSYKEPLYQVGGVRDLPLGETRLS